MKKLMKFFKDEDGVVFVEYSLIAAIIAVGLIAVSYFLRDQIRAIFNTIGNTLTSQGT